MRSSHKDSVREAAVEEYLCSKTNHPAMRAQVHLPALDLFWVLLIAQLHLPLLISPVEVLIHEACCVQWQALAGDNYSRGTERMLRERLRTLLDILTPMGYDLLDHGTFSQVFVIPAESRGVLTGISHSIGPSVQSPAGSWHLLTGICHPVGHYHLFKLQFAVSSVCLLPTVHIIDIIVCLSCLSLLPVLCVDVNS